MQPWAFHDDVIRSRTNGLYNQPLLQEESQPLGLLTTNGNTCEAKVIIENLSNGFKPNHNKLAKLEKSLTFPPTPKFSHFKLMTDDLDFTRKIRKKFYFDLLKETIITYSPGSENECVG